MVGVHSPFPKKLKSEAKKAAKILHDFTFPTASAGPDKLIPASLFLSCRGIAIITVFKAGFLVTARGGSGIVIAKLKGGKWSAPSAIGLAGLGGGFEVGAEVTDFVILLNKQSAVDAFAKGGNLTLGGNVTVAVGPIGRNLEGDVSVRSPAAIYTYSQTKGLFAGISLEGAALIERKDANKKFYGGDIRAHQILGGAVDPPEECEPLYEALRQHIKTGVEALGQMAKKEAHKKGKEAVGMAKLSVMKSIKKDKDDVAAEASTSIEPRRSSVHSCNSEVSIRSESKSWKRSSRESRSANNSPTDSPLVTPKLPSYKGSLRSNSRSTIHSDPKPMNRSLESKSNNEFVRPRTPSPMEHLSGGLVISSRSSRNGAQNSLKSSIKRSSSRAQQHLSVQNKDTKKNHSTSDLTRTGVWDKPLIGVAQEPFTGMLPCDLTFTTNDQIVILTRTDTQYDWWEGELHGRIGIFPANYIKVL